jgi:hypothetical protein
MFDVPSSDTRAAITVSGAAVAARSRAEGIAAAVKTSVEARIRVVERIEVLR